MAMFLVWSGVAAACGWRRCRPAGSWPRRIGLQRYHDEERRPDAGNHGEEKIPNRKKESGTKKFCFLEVEKYWILL
jgi:hypothetical protein